MGEWRVCSLALRGMCRRRVPLQAECRTHLHVKTVFCVDSVFTVTPTCPVTRIQSQSPAQRSPPPTSDLAPLRLPPPFDPMIDLSLSNTCAVPTFDVPRGAGSARAALGRKGPTWFVVYAAPQGADLRREHAPVSTLPASELVPSASPEGRPRFAFLCSMDEGMLRTLLAAHVSNKEAEENEGEQRG